MKHARGLTHIFETENDRESVSIYPAFPEELYHGVTEQYVRASFSWENYFVYEWKKNQGILILPPPVNQQI